LSVPAPSLGRMRRTGAVSTANIVHTPELLNQLLHEKPACWPWAAFTSVVFQRWAALEERRVQQVLGTRPLTGPRLGSGREVAQFVAQHIRDSDDLAKEIGVFMRAPTFMGVFGDPDDEGTADAESIVGVAHQLAGYYERFLELAEECQSCVVPDEYAELIGDCTQFMNLPLRDFGDFLNDVLERFEELQQCVILGQQDIHLDPVLLRTTTDDRLVWSLLDRLHTIE